jgi:quercetin dioxygenase-like cupin family protein
VTVKMHLRRQTGYHPRADGDFSRLNLPDLIAMADLPTRVLGVVDDWGKPKDCYGTALFTNDVLGADLLNIPPGARFPLHVHPGHHLLYCVAGAGTFTIGDVTHDVFPGDLFMVEGNVPHAVGSGPRDHHVILAIGSPHTHLGSPNRMTVLLEDDDDCADAIRASMTSDGVLTVPPTAVVAE